MGSCWWTQFYPLPAKWMMFQSEFWPIIIKAKVPSICGCFIVIVYLAFPSKFSSGSPPPPCPAQATNYLWISRFPLIWVTNNLRFGGYFWETNNFKTLLPHFQFSVRSNKLSNIIALLTIYIIIFHWPAPARSLNRAVIFTQLFFGKIK